MPDPIPTKQQYAHEKEAKVEWTLDELNERFPDNNLAEIKSKLAEPEFQALFDLIEQTGAKVYLGGGIVRDSLIGLTPKDFDFIVTYPDESDKEVAREKFERFWGKPKQVTSDVGKPETHLVGPYGSIKLTGKNFGVFKFYPQGAKSTSEPMDISFPRTERAWAGSLGGSREFDVQSDATLTVEEDIKRRDFTVNVLLLELRKSASEVDFQLLDYVDGLTDLESKTLRAVGDPYSRINESLDRALRAIRFKHQKGFTFTPELDQAIFDLGHGTAEYPAIMQRIGADGHPVLPREKIAIEFLKSFRADPAGTLEDYEKYGFLPHMFPNLYETTSTKTQELSRRSRRSADFVEKVTHPGDPERNRDLRIRSKTHAIDAIRYLQSHNSSDVEMVEYLYLLFHELGKMESLAKTLKSGNIVFDARYHEVSGITTAKLVRDMKFNSLDSDSPYRIEPNTFLDLSKRHAQAKGLLSPQLAAVQGNALRERPDLVSRLHKTFPGLTHDPLLRILEADMATTVNAERALSQIERLRTQLREVEEIVAVAPMLRKELFSGKTLVTDFYIPSGPQVGQLERDITEKAYYPAIAKEGYQTDIEVKRALFAYAVNHDLVRHSWSEQFADEPTTTVFQMENENPELVRRSVLKALARTIGSNYLGESLEQAARFNSEIQEILTPSAHQVEFATRFTRTLVENPQALFTWIDTGIKSERKEHPTLPCILFPEIKNMVRCQQDQRYHQEGNVWQHTQKLFMEAQRLGYTLNPELALAMLFHDVGKPGTQVIDDELIHFTGHETQGVQIFQEMANRLGFSGDEIDLAEVERMIANHGRLYSMEQTGELRYLTLRQIFPNGLENNLLKLIKLDASASVSSEPRDDQPMFAAIEEMLIQIESTKNSPYLFEELISQPEVIEVIGIGEESSKQEMLYQIYLSLNHHGLITEDTGIEQVGQMIHREFLRINRKWTGEYVKRILAPGKLFIENGIRGPEIGRRQNQIIEQLIQGETPIVEEYLK